MNIHIVDMLRSGTAVVEDKASLRTALGAGAVATAATQGAVDSMAVPVKTVITLTAFPVTVANTSGASFGGGKIYDFPEGRIGVLGCIASLTFTWTGTTIAAAGSGDFSIGSTVTADATLATTEVNILPSTAMLDPFVLGVGTGSGALAAAAQIDGTTTPVDAILNLIIDDADVSDAGSAIVLVTGTITITWLNLGDY